jgi:uncharacterized protein
MSDKSKNKFKDKLFNGVKKFVSKMPYGKKIIAGLKKQIKKSSTHSIASGFALGVFWGVMPTFGTAIIFALVFGTIFRMNRTAAILGTLVSNPLTSAFLYALGFYIGAVLVGIQYTTADILNMIMNLEFSSQLLQVLIGNVIVATLFAIFSYVVIYQIVLYARSRLAEKEEERKRELLFEHQ